MTLFALNILLVWQHFRLFSYYIYCFFFQNVVASEKTLINFKHYNNFCHFIYKSYVSFVVETPVFRVKKKRQFVTNFKQIFG